LEELVGLLENPPPGSTFAGYDPFYIPMPVPANAPTPDFVFYIYDHLGNTRVTYSAAIECNASVAYTLEAVMDYYPYGKILREYSNGEQEKYLTTQHERDVETGLDYRGARFYDADLGRFLSLDPLAAEFAEWSAYNYVLGNPVMLVDKDGRSPNSPIYDMDGNPLGTDDQGFQGEIIFMDAANFQQGMSHQDALNNGTTILNVGLTMEGWSRVATEIWRNQNGANLDVNLLWNNQISVATGFSFSYAGEDFRETTAQFNDGTYAGWMNTSNRIINGQSRVSLSVDLDNASGLYKLREPLIGGGGNPLSTVENFTSALVHEWDHVMVNLGNLNIGGTPQRELRAIDVQRNHRTWVNTTLNFKQDLFSYYRRFMDELEQIPMNFNDFSQ
jgi:RHS repeat-associated protein